MPIASVPCESRRLETEDGANGTFADATDEIAETWAIHRAARRTTKIGIDNGNVPEAVPAGKIDELILASLTLEVLVDLRVYRLTDVDDGTAVKHVLGKLTGRHRARRLRCRAVRLRAEDVRGERRPRLESSNPESSLWSGRPAPSVASGLSIGCDRALALSSDSSDDTVPEVAKGFADWISNSEARGPFAPDCA